MCRVFSVFLIYCIVTSYVQAQEIIRNVKMESEVNLKDQSIFDNEVNSNKTFLNIGVLKNKTTAKKATLENKEILENEKNMLNLTENVIILENTEILENDEMLKNNKLTNSTLVGRIVNGSEAYLGQFPQQVSLRRTGSKTHFCGGSIVALKFILTAAHCMFIGENMEFQIPATSITVVAGNILLKGSTITTQERIVQRIIIHKKFNKYTLQNDITLLQLEKPLIENEAIQVAKMPTGKAIPGTFCQVSGWGYPSANVSIISNALMFVNLPLLPRKTCRELLENITLVPVGMLCAGYMEGGKDACQGDSGGGMLCNNILTGVVSGGEGCASPRLPGIYTDIYFYRDWITSSIFNANLRNKSNSANIYFVNIFWLVASIFSAFLLSMYC